MLATQNPIENEGTYPLPEAQLDRFLFKILVEFPDRQELKDIIALTEGSEKPQIMTVLDKEELLQARTLVEQIPIADAVMDFILDIVMATHEENPYIREGASPRAAQAVVRTARARAFMENRLNVSFEDVKTVALPPTAESPASLFTRKGWSNTSGSLLPLPLQIFMHLLPFDASPYRSPASARRLWERRDAKSANCNAVARQ